MIRTPIKAKKIDISESKKNIISELEQDDTNKMSKITPETEQVLTPSVMTSPPTQTPSNISIPKLTGKNYLNWRSIMSDLIALRGFEGVVFRREDNNLLNLHAKLLIKSTLDDTHLAEVRNYEFAHEMWSHLSRMYIGTNSSDVAMLVRKFYSFNHNQGDNINTHLEKLATMREQLKNVGQEPTEEVYIDRILQTLPGEYEKLRDNWDFTHCGADLTGVLGRGRPRTQRNTIFDV